jgi:hypothetical protein
MTMVVVTDLTPPTIHCPADITKCSDPGQCGATVTYVAWATDDCGILSLVCSPPSGSFFAQGITTVNCTAIDPSTNTASCSFKVTVTQPAMCAIAASPGLTICAGRTTILTAPNGKKRYLWHGPEQDGATVQTIVVGTPGTYTCTQEEWYNGTNCCSVTVVVNPLPLCTISGGPNVSPTAPATLCGPAGMSRYVWFGPQNSGATSQCIQVTVPGTYSLQITDTNGCQNKCSTTLVNNTPQDCFITGNLSICKGLTTLLTGPNGMISYRWCGPEKNGDTHQFIVVGTPGVYRLDVVDGRGLSNSCSVNVVLNNPPPCAITAPGGGRPVKTCCLGEATTLCAPEGLLRQYWLGPQNNGLNTRCNTVTAAGTYTLVMVNSNGCESACSIRVTMVNCEQ